MDAGTGDQSRPTVYAGIRSLAVHLKPTSVTARAIVQRICTRFHVVGTLRTSSENPGWAGWRSLELSDGLVRVDPDRKPPVGVNAT